MYMQGCVALSIHVTHYDAWLGFPYYNMTTPNTEKAPLYPPHGNALRSAVDLSPGNLHQYPYISYITDMFRLS